MTLAAQWHTTAQWDSLLTSVHAWHIDPDRISPEDLQRQCLGWLTPQEQARRDHFRGPILQHANLLSRALCRATLSRYTGVDPADWRFDHNEFGKPHIAFPTSFRGLSFNLTHTTSLIACAITRAGDVGIDAEEISRPVDIDQVTRHFFSPAECSALASAPAPRLQRFYEQWVLKEAFLKGCGSGLSRLPERFTIERARDGNPLPLDHWQFTLHHPTPRHAAATAVRRATGRHFIPVVWHTAEGFLNPQSTSIA